MIYMIKYMATVFISQVLNQFIIIVNAPLRVERSLKYIQITFKVFKNLDFVVYSYRYTHCKPLKVNTVNKLQVSSLDMFKYICIKAYDN